MHAKVRMGCASALALLSLLLTLAQAREASALTVYPTMPEVGQWLVVCNDGTTWALSGGYAYVTGVGGILCGNHGGIAGITDTDVLSAIQSIATCDAPSSLTIALDRGGGDYEALTVQDIQDRLVASGGEPVELTGYQLVSLDLGGTQLVPDPVQGLPSIAIGAVYSDEDDDGTFVGGRTVPASCPATPLPFPGSAGPLIGLLLAACGAAILATRSRRTGTA